MKKLRIRMGEVNIYIYIYDNELPPRSTRCVHLSARSTTDNESQSSEVCLSPGG
jgi:hypothetical protein